MATSGKTRSGSSSGSAAGKKRAGSQSASARKRNTAQRRAKRQMHAIFLFAIGIFLAALTLFQGASAWNWLHNALFGLFGPGAIFAAAILIYIAVLLTMDKPVKARAWLCGLLLTFFCGALQIFMMGEPHSSHVLDMLVESIMMGIEVKSGGLLGTVAGLPLLLGFGKTGAGIIIVLLVFVSLMLLTGSTLIGIARAAHKPVRHLEESYSARLEKQEERRLQRESQANAHRRSIDIPLDGEARREKPKLTVIEGGKAAQKQEPQAAEEPDRKEIPADTPPATQARFDIDVPVDDDFVPSEVGGFSLELSDDPMQFVQPPEPSLDELVNRAATDSGKFRFQTDDGAQEAPNAAVFDEGQGDGDDLEPLPHFSKETVQKGEPDQEIQTELESSATIPVKPIYIKPPVTLLREPAQKADANMSEELKSNAQRLVDTLASFGVQTRIVDISRGPAVTRYELQPSAGVKISRITGLADDIALNLAAAGVRIEAPIPNKAAVGIEVPNKVISAVPIREIIDSPEFRNAKSKLTVALGRDIAGNIALADIGKMPHLLIAGSTGSGKSVCINSIIISLLFKSAPDEVRFLMIDPKVVELGMYNGIPQLLVPVVTDPKKAAGALSWAVTEMLKRYKLFADHSVRDLDSFNQLAERTEGLEKMPQVVIIIDELADLMMAAPNEIEDYICRLAQMARAAGMHLVIATQRPSVDVITGVIKANIPSRIAFAVSSQVDSRTILDMGGAEKLLGRGDMLFNPVGAAKPRRVQGCFVADDEIEAVIGYIKNDSTAEYDDQIVQEIDSHVIAGKGGRTGASESSDDSDGEDEMLMAAIECVVEAGMASTSLLQRRLKLGYARAARIVDEMEARGIVGPFEGSKPRQVLITPERLAEMKLSREE